MAKFEYVRITEDNNSKFGTAVVNDFGQKKADQKLYFVNPNGKRDVKLWDVDTPKAQELKRANVIEVISETEYKRMTEAIEAKPAEEAKPEEVKAKTGKEKAKEEGKTE